MSQTYTFTQEERMQAWKEIREIASRFSQKGWLPATSGNLSRRLSAEPLLFTVTASGRDKENLQLEDLILVDEAGVPVEPTRLKPSAETLIHAAVYRRTAAGCVLHVHTVYNNLVSEIYAPQGEIPLSNQELIKALGIWEEGASIAIPVFPNHADLTLLAKEVAAGLREQVPAILIRNHGLYAWGETAAAAQRHVEALEFMFQYHFMWLTYERAGIRVHPSVAVGS